MTETQRRKLDLEQFLPYRLTKLTGQISRGLADKYADRFDLTIQEWRVVAILGSNPGMTAKEVGARSSLDKVSVSRAVDRLYRAGRLEKSPLENDRRAAALHLTAKGEEVLQGVTPLALAYEASVLAPLDESDKEALVHILAKLEQWAEEQEG